MARIWCLVLKYIFKGPRGQRTLVDEKHHEDQITPKQVCDEVLRRFYGESAHSVILGCLRKYQSVFKGSTISRLPEATNGT